MTRPRRYLFRTGDILTIELRYADGIAHVRGVVDSVPHVAATAPHEPDLAQRIVLVDVEDIDE